MTVLLCIEYVKKKKTKGKNSEIDVGKSVIGGDSSVTVTSICEVIEEGRGGKRRGGSNSLVVSVC